MSYQFREEMWNNIFWSGETEKLYQGYDRAEFHKTATQDFFTELGVKI